MLLFFIGNFLPIFFCLFRQMSGGQPVQTENFFSKKTNAFLNARPLDKSIVLWYNISIKRGGKGFETPLETTAEVDDLEEKKNYVDYGKNYPKERKSFVGSPTLVGLSLRGRNERLPFQKGRPSGSEVFTF